MQISKETVEHTAKLACIKLDSKELEKFARQLHDILEYIDKLSKLNLEQVKPTDHILSISNVLREDQPHKSLPADQALMNAPQQQEGFFVVPKVI
ncbi:MAG: Asp-tRNA(Asn)/Glu-tRNA(Gln) amidotransferase subunit GatC [Candidatus Omnitrophica bacterium]|nr:Asp-tRNA(Asn)/Glu-tRNA(Gln) amidotransferase subunit GatC [Candidatus Omnitrophota bacterium]MBL7210726.1 Asp-tRNA(Asn)/Glu-tRNA(Gln) amidotransferase subunit GatC [Candidatus Omnitrophota bacterium]